MKKRSLVAAVAMLLVSALVLTSATFAWFAKGTATSVTTMTTTVTNSDGSLLVAAKNADGFFKTSISADDFIATGDYEGLTATNNALKPVDMKLATLSSEPVFYGCSYDGYTFTAGAAASGDYLVYNWYIKADKAGTIELNPSFNAGTGTGFVYGLVRVNNICHVYGTSSDTYTPFDDNNLTATEAGTPNGVVEAGEVGAGALAANAVSVTNDASIQIAATANQVYTVTCYIWAEGQDTGCFGSVSNSGATFSFAPSLTLPATPNP